MLFKFCIPLLFCIPAYRCNRIKYGAKLIQCNTLHQMEANQNFCNFFDTLLDKENYGTITYLKNQIKIQVPEYTRDCVCKYKKCFRLCCPLEHLFVIIKIESEFHYKCVRYYLDMDLNNVIVNKNPCQVDYWSNLLQPLQQWDMLSDGSISIGEHRDALIMDSNRYCLANITDNSTGRFITNIMFCSNATDSEIPISSNSKFFSFLHATFMLVPVIFYSLTLFVYFWIDELKTVHGKTVMCYLATLILAYTALAFYHYTNWHASKQPISCIILAEIIYVALIAAFIWLSIIGYDIWREVSRRIKCSNQFSKYCLFTGVTTFIIVLLTNMFDHINLLDDHFRPGFGTSRCWLQDTKYAHFLYLYSIIIIIVIINIVFFLLTKRKLEWVKEFSRCATDNGDSKKISERDVDHFHLFCEIGIVMGLPWLFEILSWLMNADNYIIYVAEIVTMLQGPVILFLSIKKPRVSRLIKETWSLYKLRIEGIM